MLSIMEMMKDFLEFDPRKSEIEASNAPSTVFTEIGKKQALETFRLSAKTVPAYRDFLLKNKINPEKIKTYDDFVHIPLTDKKNYLTKYPLKDLLINGNYTGKSSITSSSGSTGEPIYLPRFASQDFGATKGFDLYLTNTFDIDHKKTLHLNCSGMGVWTAGDYIGLLNKFLSYKYPLNSSTSPGLDLESSTRLIENISPDFEQTIIFSYPPFAKDLIDNLPSRNHW